MSHGNNDYDIFKQSPIRFLGYTNELGEAFRPIIPTWLVTSTYCVAFLYAAGDTFDKANKAYNNNNDNNTPIRKALDAGLYTITWQALASLIVPPFFINRVMATSRFFLKRFTNYSTVKRRWICVGIGLCTIPIIFKPIDKGVHYTLENTYKPFSKTYICPK